MAIETMVDANKNLGDNMPGFGTLAIILKILVCRS